MCYVFFSEGHHEVTTTLLDNGIPWTIKCFSADLIGNEVGPYLFPFVIEFALIAASILFKMFVNVGQKPEETGEHVKQKTSIEKMYGGECHKANSGLFRGLLLFTITLLLTAIFLIVKERYQITNQIGGNIYFSCNIGLNIIGILSIIPAFFKLRYLTYKPKLESSFDQNLAIIALGGYYFLIGAMIIASAAELNNTDQTKQHYAILHFVSSLLTFVQMTQQMAFIIDSLHRRSTVQTHIVIKPGRSTITFLLLLNISMWIVNTFQLKELANSSIMSSFYGNFAWIIMIQLFLPLSIFYRFHSAVCLTEIWSKAYERETDDLESEDVKVTVTHDVHIIHGDLKLLNTEDQVVRL